MREILMALLIARTIALRTLPGGGRSARGLTQRRCVRVCSREMVTLRAVVLNDGESPPPVGKFGTPLPPVELELDPRRIAVFAAPSVEEAIRLDDERAARRLQPTGVVQLVRGSAPYIELHQHSTMVIHVASEIVERAEPFQDIMDDVATLHVLGVRVVLVVSLRTQLDARIAEQASKSSSTKKAPSMRDLGERVKGLRPTDNAALAAVQIESGLARSKVEAALSRGLRRGGESHGRSRVGVDVVSGNGLYTARPVGVVDGVDMGWTGAVRHVEVEKIDRHLLAGEIVLLTSLAHSASGETFNVRSEEVAARAAPALGASKLIFITAGHELVWRQEDDSNADAPRLVASLRLADAKRLDSLRSEIVDQLQDVREKAAAGHVLDLCGWSVAALERGVTRAHLVPPSSGALIRELYTRDGAGTLVSRDLYEGIRPAGPNDLDAMVDLIEPLELDGTLVTRARGLLRQDIVKQYTRRDEKEETFVVRLRI